ncbi:HNH endonuclease signature motif containing protein [Pseudomonas sp. NPDC087598]|uniref:HNH endonuclease signature motif containing protein n=1 Tax=Pseudomonas sp. NPDC087598 TaxID=3364440 RepID=UPI0038275BF2
MKPTYPIPFHQVGGRKKFEIHHQHEVANGGAVYDMENLLIMTAKRHIEKHKE